MYSLIHDAKKVVGEMALRFPADVRERLLFDLQHASAELANEDGAIVSFKIAGYQMSLPRGRHLFHVEGSVLDEDGSKLTVLLHSDANGRLMELELVRYDEGSVIKPDWSTLNLF